MTRPKPAERHRAIGVESKIRQINVLAVGIVFLDCDEQIQIIRSGGLDEDPVTSQLVGAAVCAEQVSGLVDEGVRQFHFYTQNRADLSFAICHLLGLRAHKSEFKKAVGA